MSSIAFPHSSDQLPDQSSSHDSDSNNPMGGGFYNSPFENASGFQMNPLSSHPPRTPRPSNVSSSMHAHHFSGSQTPMTGSITQMYNSGMSMSVYDEKDGVHTEVEVGQLTIEVEGSDTSETMEKAKEAETKVRKQDIFREMLETSNGRDKIFKLIQYSIRVYLVFHMSLSNSALLQSTARPPWEKELVRRLESTRSGLSFTRKMLILFNWLTPLSTITVHQSVPFASQYAPTPSPYSKSSSAPHPFLQTLLQAPPPLLLELVNGLSDDIYTLSRLGLLGKRTGERAARFSDWCWFIGTLVGLVENEVEKSVVEGLQREVETRLYKESLTGATAKSKSAATTKIENRELSRLHTKSYWLQISRAKLVMDLIFVSFDVFKIKRFSEPVKAFAGLAAAILSSMKLYNRHQSALVKAVGA